jgi:hypothetical protein
MTTPSQRPSPGSKPLSKPPSKPLMRSLGEFVGHIWSGVKTDPSKPAKQTTRREVETETRDTPQGKVVLRRTTIEEVEVQPKKQG